MDAPRLAALRAEFPVTERFAYLNHAGIGAMPRCAAAVAAGAYRDLSAGGDERWPARNAHCEVVRGQVARLIGAREREIAFTQCTGDGLSIIACGLPWRAGDNVVGLGREYPANVYPWMQLRDFGVELRTAAEREGRFELDDLLGLIDGKTRVVAPSWVHWATGYRLDLAAVAERCREVGALLVVDVIQGLGALALDVEGMGIDACAAATHKWLLGPEGLGLLYVSDRVLDRIRPTRFGQRTVRQQFDWGRLELDYNDGAKRFEPGSLPHAAIASLGASLLLLEELGREAVEERVLALAERAAEGLLHSGFQLVSSRRPAERSGIVTATHPRLEMAAVSSALRTRGVITAERLGRLRVAPHAYNSEAEIDRLIRELATL